MTGSALNSDANRLAALARYPVLDTPPEPAFDDIAALAAEICETPIAVVNIVAGDRQFFKAEVGLGVRETPLETSFCVHALLEEDFLLVPDATKDPRFACNPLVTQQGGLRFYAGALLKTPDGVPIGTLCVLDHRVRDLSARQVRALERLARQVVDQLELRRVLAAGQLEIEDRKAAQAELAISGQSLRLATDAANLGTWDLDLVTDVLTWSDRTKACFGMSPDAPCSMADFYAGLHPDDRDTTAAAFTSAVDPAVRATYDVEYRTIGKDDGILRWVAAAGRGLFDEDGRCIRAIGTAIDITPRKQTEERLRASEARLRELNETLEQQVAERTADRDRMWRNAQEIFLVAVPGGGIRAVSPSVTAILGWAPEDMIGGAALDFVLPEDVATAGQALAEAIEHRVSSVELRMRHMEGGFRWVSWATFPENGLIYAVGRHVSREKAAVEALQQSDARLRTIFETNYQLQGLLTADGILLEANSTALAVIGTRIDDVAGRFFWDTPWFAATRGMPGEVEAAVREAALGRAMRREVMLDVPGGVRTFDFALHPVFDARGAVATIIADAIDITERREAEAALRQAQKLEAMGQLTGGVAHDFNNLLTPIIGSLDMLQRRGIGGERERRLIEGGLQAADRAKTLVHRLLAFARRQPLQPVAVEVKALVEGMADLIASTSGPGILVSVEVDTDLPPAKADPNQLELAILNLSVNARDAMPDGGTMTISASAEQIGSGDVEGLAPGAYVRIAVADTGIGMDEALARRVIEPFFSTKGVGKGTGLGLSMVHGLASQLGGALAIDSVPGRGTTVIFWLPVASERVPDPVARAAVAASREAPRGLALLVDDEDIVRMSTADMLADIGYHVAEANSGEKALELIDGGLQPDLLVTDHLMPGISGVFLARAVMARRPDLPVLLISGYAETDELPEDMPRLAKPFRQGDLLASVTALNVRA